MKNENDINVHIERYHRLRIDKFTSLGTGLFIYHMNNATMQLFLDEAGWNVIVGKEMTSFPEELEYDIFAGDNADIQKIGYSDILLFGHDILARGHIRTTTLDRKGMSYTTPPIIITIRPWDHYAKDIIEQKSDSLTDPLLIKY